MPTTVTDIADELQSQVRTAVQTIQDGVVGALEWVSERAETRLPDAVVGLANRLPETTTHYLDRGFETAEQWLRSQHEFATRVAEALKPTVDATKPTA